MSFPSRPYPSMPDFVDDYFRQYASSAKRLSHENLVQAAETILLAYKAGNNVYVCGNGGSAAIANHLVCDHSKGVQAKTALMPGVISLSSNVEIITAVANDIEYNDIFLFQLRTLAKEEDCLITISSSGDSENIVRALSWARKNGLHTISMTGFGGGRSAKLADINLHVGGDNYGVIEDVHQSIMHILAQYLSLAEMDPTMVSDSIF